MTDDIHRVYPHTREPFGLAIHNAHWALVAVKERAVRDYIERTRHLFREPFRPIEMTSPVKIDVPRDVAERLNAMLDQWRAEMDRRLKR